MLSATSANSTSTSNFWEQFPESYRAKEIKELANWFVAGESGSVVGLVGSGRATLLSYLCQRPGVLKPYLEPSGRQVILVPIDLADLPQSDLSTLYRTILRAFFEISGRFDEFVEKLVADLYRRVESAADPFLPQSALRELLLYFQQHGIGVAFVFHNFVRFCKNVEPEMTQTLQGLRNSFRDTLFFIVGLPQEVIYLSDLEPMNALRHLLDTNVCWIGPLNSKDTADMTRFRIRHQTREINQQELDDLFALTGGFPALIRVVCDWWLAAQGLPIDLNLPSQLLERPNVLHRLGRIWDGLTQEEKKFMSGLVQPGTTEIVQDRDNLESKISRQLEKKGVIQIEEGVPNIVSQLLADFIIHRPEESAGKIWFNEKTKQIFSGDEPIDNLPPTSHALLEFFVKNPHKRHSHNDLIDAAWPDDVKNVDAVSPDALYQSIRTIRKAIEPKGSKPQFVINRQGGYQFFPEGRPNV